MRWRWIAVGLYLALAVGIWVDFLRTPPDGLANLGLMLAVLPVTLFGLALGWAAGAERFILLPSGLGYHAAHAAFYWPSVLATALLLLGLATVLRRRRR